MCIERAVSDAASRSELQEPVQRVVVHQQEESASQEELLNPWAERARELWPVSTLIEQVALARALRHAPNDGAAVVMAPQTLEVAQRC